MTFALAVAGRNTRSAAPAELEERSLNLQRLESLTTFRPLAELKRKPFRDAHQLQNPGCIFQDVYMPIFPLARGAFKRLVVGEYLGLVQCFSG